MLLSNIFDRIVIIRLFPVTGARTSICLVFFLPSCCLSSLSFIDVVLSDGLLTFLVGVIILALQLVIVIRKFAELGIVDALCCVEGQWEDFKGVLSK